MKITSIHIRPITGGGKLLAVASVTMDNEMIIRSIKIIEANGKRFIRMPYTTSKKGVHVDVVHPIKRDARWYLEDTILTAYQKTVTEMKGQVSTGWIKTVL